MLRFWKRGELDPAWKLSLEIKEEDGKVDATMKYKKDVDLAAAAALLKTTLTGIYDELARRENGKKRRVKLRRVK